MKYVVLVKPNGEITAEPVSTVAFLADLKRLVGGNIERCSRYADDLLINGTALIVSDVARCVLDGLPYNPTATQISGNPNEHLVGNAIIARFIFDGIAPFDGKTYTERHLIQPLKYKLAQMLESHDDE